MWSVDTTKRGSAKDGADNYSRVSDIQIFFVLLLFAVEKYPPALGV